MPDDISRIGSTGGTYRVPPVNPVADTGSATQKPKDSDTGPGPKKPRQKLLDDGNTVEIYTESGEVVTTTVDKFREEYRRIFGEDPPPGSLLHVMG